MKKMLKTLVVCATMLIGVTTVSAQSKGDMATGLNFAIGMGDDFTNYGLGAKFQYNILDNLRLEPSFTYFFEKDYMSNWDLSLNAHYLIPVMDRLCVYPLAGIGVFGANIDMGVIEGDESWFIGNVGAGVEYDLGADFALGMDYKFKFGDDIDRSVLAIGLTYKF